MSHDNENYYAAEPGWLYLAERRSSDAEKWFDDSNRHKHAAIYGGGDVDVDVDDNPSVYHPNSVPTNTNESEGMDASSSRSCNDYQSIINDQMVEIRSLKRELRQYQAMEYQGRHEGKLFEVKVHNMPNADKRRELEETLQAFVTGLSNTHDLSRRDMTPSSKLWISPSSPSANARLTNSSRMLPDGRLKSEVLMPTKLDLCDGFAATNVPAEKFNFESWLRRLPSSSTCSRQKRRCHGSATFYNSGAFVVDLVGESVYSQYCLISEPQYECMSRSKSSPKPLKTAMCSSIDHWALQDITCGWGTNSTSGNSHLMRQSPQFDTDIVSRLDERNAEPIWSSGIKQKGAVYTLRPSGTSGVLPDDHFIIRVTTLRVHGDSNLAAWMEVDSNPESTTSQTPALIQKPTIHEPVNIKYISSCVDKLNPVRLPPLPMNFSFSSTTSESGGSSNAWQ